MSKNTILLIAAGVAVYLIWKKYGQNKGVSGLGRLAAPRRVLRRAAPSPIGQTVSVEDIGLMEFGGLGDVLTAKQAQSALQAQIASGQMLQPTPVFYTQGDSSGMSMGRIGRALPEMESMSMGPLGSPLPRLNPYPDVSIQALAPKQAAAPAAVQQWAPAASQAAASAVSQPAPSPYYYPPEGGTGMSLGPIGRMLPSLGPSDLTPAPQQAASAPSAQQAAPQDQTGEASWGGDAGTGFTTVTLSSGQQVQVV